LRSTAFFHGGMQMKLQTLHDLYSERLKGIEHIIDMESKDDEDLRQEGFIL
jgi:hypothetical protein